MKRIIYQKLLDWKNSSNRKVLLLRGARQVGKTYIVRKLGSTFDNYLEVNFEMDKDVHSFFKNSLDPIPIIEKLSLYFNQPIKEKKTLLFFDEIQACPEALQSIRFFYEKIPNLHLISAGSVLEFALSEISSFGVGRIESFYMYPMTFFEFLNALNKNILVDCIKSASFNKPVEEVLHNKILEHFRVYQILGGLPEVIKVYINTHNYFESGKVLDNHITTLIDDFSKYKKKFPVEKIKEVFNSVALQTGSKFKYSNISQDRSELYKKALNLLLEAHLAYKIYHTSADGLPLGARIKTNKFKVSIFDTGIYQRLSGLDLSKIIKLNHDELINKGNFSELTVSTLLAASSNTTFKPELYYWHREKRGSNAEVDFIISCNEKIIPIEVKSGTKGSMQSMYIFLDEKKIDFGIRVSAENFSEYDKIIVLPIYAIENIYNYLQK